MARENSNRRGWAHLTQDRGQARSREFRRVVVASPTWDRDQGKKVWKYAGQSRARFAKVPKKGQVSVWDFPHPSASLVDIRRVVARSGNHVVADSRRALRVIETASPPAFYLPPKNVQMNLLVPAEGDSLCERKGDAINLSVAIPGGPVLRAVAWRHRTPTPVFDAITGWISFYPARLLREVDGERAQPQPGGCHGGWLTGDIAGPVKAFW